MSIVELALAKKQVRLPAAIVAEDDLLQQHLDAAEGAAARFLNRNLYADEATLQTAVDAVPTMLTAAQTAYDTAASAWWADPDPEDAPRALAWEKATRDYREAKAAARRTYGGLVPNAQVTQAILLAFGDFANNREATITDAGGKALELPTGARTLLNPFRIDEGV